MVMVATLTLLAAIGLVLLLAGASYVTRNAPVRGVALIALALGLAASSAVSIVPALQLTDGGTDGAFREAEVAELRLQRDQLLLDVTQKARDNEALAKTTAFFSKLHKERMTRIADELRNVRDIVLGPGSGIVLPSDAPDVTLTSFVDGPAGFEAILGDLKRLKGLRLRTTDDPDGVVLAMLAPARNDSGVTGRIVEPSAAIGRDKDIDPSTAELSPATQEQETLTALRRALDSKMSTNTYRVEPLAEPELIAGRKGRYYVIELRSAKTGDRFTFDSGKYTFQTARGAYKGSFNAFAADVLKQLEGRTSFDLLVRGSADAQAYQGPLEPGFEYRKVAYLPSTGRGSYLANAATMPVGGIVKNADLPNLRGEYLRGFLGELYPAHPAVVLEGQVVKKDNPAARNTELVLFVAW